MIIVALHTVSIVATCLPTDSCLLNGHLNLTLTYNVRVTERSQKTSVGRQSDSIFQQATTHPPPKTFLTLPGVLPPSVIPFWKPLMTTNLNPKSDAKNLQIFLQPILQPILQPQRMNTSRGPTPK